MVDPTSYPVIARQNRCNYTTINDTDKEEFGLNGQFCLMTAAG